MMDPAMSRPCSQFQINGCLDPLPTTDLLAQALWRDHRGAGCASWYGARASSRVAPMTELGRRLFGLHLFIATTKE
jgi:hypothetical protein